MSTITRRAALAAVPMLAAAMPVMAGAEVLNRDHRLSPELAALFDKYISARAAAREFDRTVYADAKQRGADFEELRALEEECTDRFHVSQWGAEDSILAFEPRSLADVEAQLRMFGLVKDEAEFANLIADAVRRLAGAA